MSTTGHVQYVHQGLTTAQAAIGRVITAGEFSHDPQNHEIDGVGAQRVVRKGTSAFMLTGLEVFAPDATWLAKFFRTAAGCQVAAFPDHTVGIDGGAGYIEIYSLEDCQPAKVSVKCPAEGPLTATVDIWSATPTLIETTQTVVQLASTKVGHTNNEITATVDAASYGIVEWSFDLDNGAFWDNDQDGKTAASKTDPTAVLLGNEALSLSVTTGMPIPSTAWDPTSDEYIATSVLELFEAVFAGANGVAAENITFTMAALKPGARKRSLAADGSKVLWQHSFTGGVAVANVAVT